MSHIHINISDLSFGYEKNQKILKHINLDFSEEESVGIIGRNGAGKSTLLKLMTGLYLDFEGSIRVENIPVEKKMLARVREKIGYVFQDSDSQLFTPSVYDDVAFAPRNYGFSEEETEKRVCEALEKVHISYLKDKRTHKLSGGEKKLVSIATILSLTPDIILMDEPSAALDPRNRRNLIHILNEFDHLKIIASHDLDFIMATCSRVVLLNDGEVVRDGKPEEILTDKDLLESNGL